MAEKPQENQPTSIFDRMTPEEQSAALSRFLEAEAEKQSGATSERLKNRGFFPEPADGSNAEKVKAKILKFPEQPKAPVETEIESSGIDPKEMEKITSDPEQWLKDTISKPQKVMDDPYAAVEGMAKAQEVSQQKKAA